MEKAPRLIREATGGSAYDTYRWRTPKKQWDELVQVTDSYVVHARGWTVENDIWLDEYAVKSGHKKWWSRQLEEEYDGHWTDTYPNQVLYWSITGGSAFILQQPQLDNLTDESVFRLKDTLDELQVPNDCEVHFSDGDYNECHLYKQIDAWI